MLVERVVLYLDTDVIQEKIICEPPSVLHLIKKSSPFSLSVKTLTNVYLITLQLIKYFRFFRIST